jgi:hypothetical protein
MLEMRKKEATLGKVVLQRFLYGVDKRLLCLQADDAR